MRRLYRRLFEMREFSERNPYVVGAIGIGVVVAAILLAVNYDKVPFVTGDKEYAAYFAEAGGLETNGVVEVSGARIGKVASVALDGPKVLVKFRIPGDIRLGERTEAAVKVKNFLGTKVIELTPRGEGRLTGPIPLERTTPAYQLPDVLGDLSATVTKLNTDQLSNALSVVAGEFSGTPPEVKAAVEGVARFSQTLDERDKELRNLLGNANKVTKVLAERSDEIVKLVGDTDSLLVALKAQSRFLDKLLVDNTTIAYALGAIVDDNHATLRPALEKLNGVVALLNNRKGRIQEAIKGLDSFALGAGRSGFLGPVLQGLPGQPGAGTVHPAVHRLRVPRPGTRSRDPIALAAHRPADRPAGHTATAAPVPADRPGRRPAPAHPGRHHREPR